MRKIFIRLIIGTVICILVYSCAHNVKEFTKEPEVQVESDQTSYISFSPYYYFLNAQFQKKQGNLDNAILNLEKAVKLDSDSIYLKKELVVLYLHKKDNEKVLALVNEILAKDPKDSETLILIASIKQLLKKEDDVKQIYEKALQSNPNHKDIYIILGELYMIEGDMESALRIYNTFIKNFPDSYKGYFVRGQIYFKQNDLKKAELDFQKVRELHPDLTAIYFELLKIYKKQKLDKKVSQTYQQILSIDSDNIQANMDLGLYYYNKKEFQKSKEIFQILGIRSLADKQISQRIVQLYIEQEQYQDAIIILNGMLESAPQNDYLNYIIGVAYESVEENQKAIEHFKQILLESEFYYNAVIHTAFLYQTQGETKKAIEFLKQEIQKDENVDFFLYLGSFYEDIGDYENAEKILLKGLEIDEQDIKLHFRLGIVYDKWDKDEQSEQQMKTVIEIDPQNANALNYLGYTYAESEKNLDEAEKLVKAALKYKPDDGYITDSLGWVYFKKGLFQQALKQLEKAVEIVPDDPTILEHLGDVYKKLGENEKALENYKKSFSYLKEKNENLEKKINDLESIKQ